LLSEQMLKRLLREGYEVRFKEYAEKYHKKPYIVLEVAKDELKLDEVKEVVGHVEVEGWTFECIEAERAPYEILDVVLRFWKFEEGSDGMAEN